MTLALLLVAIACAAAQSSLPSGPPGATGQGIYKRADGAFVYDFWSSNAEIGSWGPGGTPSYCQQLDSPNVTSYLSEIWFATDGALNVDAWATVNDFTGQTLGALLYNASQAQNMTGQGIQIKFPNGVKLSSGGTYLWCISAYGNGGSNSVDWFTTPNTTPTPSADGWYNNDVPLDESGMTDLTYPFTYYAVFTSDSTCTKCTDKGDYWCLDTDACSSELPKDCPDYVQSPSLCPVNCESFQTCAECTDQNSACEYCISSGDGSCHASGDVSGVCSSTRISKSQFCPAQ